MELHFKMKSFIEMKGQYFYSIKLVYGWKEMENVFICERKFRGLRVRMVVEVYGNYCKGFVVTVLKNLNKICKCV